MITKVCDQKKSDRSKKNSDQAFLRILLNVFQKFFINLWTITEAYLGLLQHPNGALCDNSQRLEAINYYHKALHLGCCSSSRSASEIVLQYQNNVTWNSATLT